MSEGEPRRPRQHVWIVVAAILAAIALRAYGLGAKSAWLDEAMSVERAHRDLWRPFWEDVKRDNHPFLYYLLLHFALKLGTGDVAIRLVSLAASVIATLGTWALAREALGARAAAWATVLSGMSAYQLFFAQEARPYALATMFAAGSCWMWVRMWKRGLTASRLAAYALFSVLAVYSFYYSGLLLVAHAVHAAIEWWLRGRVEWRLVGTWAAMGAVISPLLIHLRYLARLTGLGTRKPGAMDPAAVGQAAREHLFGYMPFPDEQARLLAGLAVVAGIAIVAACVWTCVRERRAALPLVCVLIVPLLLLLVYRAPVRFESKHLAVIAPVLWTLFAAFGRERGRGDLALGVVLLVNLGSCWYYHSDRFVKEDWRGIAEFVEERWQPGDKVVFAPFYLRFPFERYFTRRPYDYVRVTYAGPKIEADATYWVLDNSVAARGLYVLDDGRGLRAITPWEVHAGRYWVIEGESNTIPRSDIIPICFSYAYDDIDHCDRAGMSGYLWATLWQPKPR